MAVDLKLDILYYNTPTDFEMEFSLSSRCVMRMLTSKSETAKDYLSQLSRAVSRSRVIICVGDIYNSNSVISITSQAVGRSLCSYDFAAYNVTDEASKNILLPDGALPLVTEDGTLGGCLIESGPQIIIFLSDQKPLRKRILKELVFEYITALSGINTSNSETEKTDLQEQIVTEESVHLEQEAESEQPEEAAETIEENPTEEPTQDEPTKEEIEDNNDHIAFTEIHEDSDQDFEDSDDYDYTQKKSKFLGLKVTIGILCTILAVIVGVLVYYYIK